jgi:DNA-binding transcriptional LysR family regulator
MIAVPLARPIGFICVASPAYLARAGEPTTPDDLQHHRCIGHRMPSGKLYRWEFKRAGQELTIDTNGPIILDDEGLMADAAAQGLGIAYVASWAAEAAIAEGRLRAVLSAWTYKPERAAVYYPGHRAVPPALRAFLDVVKERA